MRTYSALKSSVATSVVALSFVGQSVAAPMSMLQTPSPESPAPGNVVQKTQVSMPQMPKMPKLPHKGMFSKWFGGSHQEPIAEFTEPKQDPKAIYAYQAPQTPQRVAMNTAPPTPTLATNSTITTALPEKKLCTEEQTKSVVEQSQALEAQGQVDPARQTLIKHLTEYSYDVRAIRALGHLEDRAGNLAQAEIHYRQALGANASSASAMNDLGLCLARQGRLDEANSTLHEAIQLQPAKALYRNNVATVLVELGDKDAALSHLQGVYPPATASYNLGQILIRSGKTDAAVESFKQALMIDPDHAAAAKALKKHGGAEAAQATKEVATTEQEQTKPAETPQADITPLADDQSDVTPEDAGSLQHNVVAVAGAPAFPRLLPPVLDR